MASYKGVNGALLALEAFFANRLPAELRDPPINAGVSLLGSADIADSLSGNVLGIYLHRISIDPHGRSRYFPAQGSSASGEAQELPVNLHLLIIAVATSATIEADLMSWAMLALASDGQLDISQVAEVDADWGEQEILTIVPEELSIEELMRIWDVFEAPYTLTMPYVARTVRLRLKSTQSEGPPVRTRVFPMGRL
jgi:hypothetical protein